MDAVSLLRHLVTSAHGQFAEAVSEITPAEWTRRPHAGSNLLGFTAWHVPAVQDWALHTWMRGTPELRGGPGWSARPGINPAFAAFGMPLEDADAIAHAVSTSDVLAYADAVLAACGALCDGLSEAGLDAVGDTRTWGTRLPQHRTAGYLAEVDDMYDLPVWRLLAGPCFGHARQHVGEMRASLAMLRA